MQFNDLQNNPSIPIRTLSRHQLAHSPFDQFRIWFEEAIAAGIVEPNAMALATASQQGHPSCRMVLMKNFDANGLVFFTNYQSRKAIELQSQKYASTCFFWKELERQVLVEGTVEKASTQESQNYFESRSRNKRLSALTSQQDSVISSRKVLEEEFTRLEKKYNDQDIPLPDNWGGFRLTPSRFEFWQGRPDRLHDRFQYKLENGKWNIVRLSP